MTPGRMIRAGTLTDQRTITRAQAIPNRRPRGHRAPRGAMSNNTTTEAHPVPVPRPGRDLDSQPLTNANITHCVNKSDTHFTLTT